MLLLLLLLHLNLGLLLLREHGDSVHSSISVSGNQSLGHHRVEGGVNANTHSLKHMVAHSGRGITLSTTKLVGNGLRVAESRNTLEETRSAAVGHLLGEHLELERRGADSSGGGSSIEAEVVELLQRPQCLRVNWCRELTGGRRNNGRVVHGRAGVELSSLHVVVGMAGNMCGLVVTASLVDRDPVLTVRSAGTLTLLGAAVGRVGLVAGRESNLIHKTLVSLGRSGLQLGQDVADGDRGLGAGRLVEEWSGQHLEDKSCSTLRVLEDSLQSCVVRGAEKCLQDSLASLGLSLLVNNLKDGQVCNLVGAQVNQVGNKTGSQDCSAVGEATGIQEPGQQESSIGVGCELHTVNSNGGGKHTLLALVCVVALQARPHGTRSKAALSNFPHSAQHSLKDVIVKRRSKAKTALENVVSVLVQEQRNSVWPKRVGDLVHLSGSLRDIDNLLTSPGTVFV